MKTNSSVKPYTIPANCATTRLERNALAWLNDSDSYEDGAKGRYKDLMHGGCQSGLVNHLIYSVDCRTFLKRHRGEINTMLASQLSDCGFTSPAELIREWDAEDPLGMDLNADRLAWFGFEQAARNVADRAGLEG